MSDNDIARLWSEGLMRPEIAARTGASLAHVRHVVKQARLIEAGEEAHYKHIHVGGARSEIGAIARASRLPYAVVRRRWKHGKRGADLIEPVRPYGVPKPQAKGVDKVHALPSETPPLVEAIIAHVALAKFQGWSVAKICETFDVHPRQVRAIRARAPADFKIRLWNVAGEMLTIEEIALRAGVRSKVIESRLRVGWRGLRLLQPLLRRPEEK